MSDMTSERAIDYLLFKTKFHDGNKQVVELIKALTAENAKLREENATLLLDAINDEQRRRLDRFIRQHGDLNDDLWDELISERDKLKEQVEKLQGTTIVNRNQSLETDTLGTDAWSEERFNNS